MRNKYRMTARFKRMYKDVLITVRNKHKRFNMLCTLREISARRWRSENLNINSLYKGE